MNKNIFQYFNGSVEVFGDPIALHRALIKGLRAQGGDLAEVCKLANTHEMVDGVLVQVRPQSQAAEYQEYLYAAAREAFGLGVFKPLTGEGILDEDVLKIIDSFFEWEAKKKASTDPSPMSPPPSESPGQSPTTNS